MPTVAEKIARPLRHKEVYYTEKAVGPKLDKVFSLRYRSYVADRYIKENNSRKFMDNYDSFPTCRSYLLYENRRAIASMRSCIYNPTDDYSVPCLEVFKDEIRSAIGLDDVFVEANKFVVDPEYQSKRGRRVRMLLFSTVVGETQSSLAKNVVVAVRPEHIKFYSRFNCEQISDVKRYPNLSFDTVLMVCKNENINDATDTILSRSITTSRFDEPIFSNSYN